MRCGHTEGRHRVSLAAGRIQVTQGFKRMVDAPSLPTKRLNDGLQKRSTPSCLHVLFDTPKVRHRSEAFSSARSIDASQETCNNFVSGFKASKHLLVWVNLAMQ